MSIMVSRDFESKNYFMHLYNSNGLLMTRIPVNKEIASLNQREQYEYVKENHPDLYKRIK